MPTFYKRRDILCQDQKKDGKMLNLYIDKKVIDRLEKYAEEKGQTKTIAVERLLTKALDIEENKKD